MNQSLGTKQVFNIGCVDLDILGLHIRGQETKTGFSCFGTKCLPPMTS